MRREKDKDLCLRSERQAKEETRRETVQEEKRKKEKQRNDDGKKPTIRVKEKEKVQVRTICAGAEKGIPTEEAEVAKEEE